MRTIRGVGALAVGISISLSAIAEEPSAADVSSARELGREGVKLADAGKCNEAIEKLRVAAGIVPVPSLLGRLGECQVEVGLLIEGTETLQRVTREKLPANAPEAFVVAQARAQKVLDLATPRVPKVRITVLPEAARPTITIDGVAVPASLVGAPRPANPGAHTVVVSAAGYRTATQQVTLKEATSEVVTFTLEPAPVVAPPAVVPPPGSASAAPPQAAPAPPAAPKPSSPASRTPAYVAFGVGGAGVIAGTIFGVVALGKKSDLDKTCAAKACPPGSGGDIDSMSTMATLSTVGFAVGLVGAGVGVYLLTSASKTDSPAAAVHVGPGNVSLRGSF